MDMKSIARQLAVIDKLGISEEDKKKLKSRLSTNSEQIKKEHSVIDELDRSDEDKKKLKKRITKKYTPEY